MAFMNGPRLKNLGKTCDRYAPSIPDKHFGRSPDVRKIIRSSIRDPLELVIVYQGRRILGQPA
jgi:hypothetical protein